MKEKITLIFKTLSAPFKRPSLSWFPYLLLSGFIVGWWGLAFRSATMPITFPIETSQTLVLKTSTLLEKLSPIQRDSLQRALSGHVPQMLDFIERWDQDALFLANEGIEGVQRLPSDIFLQAQILGHLIQESSPESLRQLNCKMNLESIADDQGNSLSIEDSFQRFLPQTYISASFLLAIAKPQEIIALPKGLRQQNDIYSTDILATIPKDIDQLSSEALYSKKPDLAFVAPYSHPPSLEALRNQNIQLYTIKHIDTLSEIQEALLKVGHASNHILEAQLLAIFMEASLLSIDNRLLALPSQTSLSRPPIRLCYLSHRQHYALPTTKCLTGQLMTRALKCCPHLLGSVPESRKDWQIPFALEQIVQADPDAIIVATHKNSFQLSPFDQAFQQIPAFKSKRIFYLDEAVQESPTQYIVLAYFDLFQALAAIDYL